MQKGNAYDPFVANTAIAACYHFLDFFIHCTNPIAVDGTSRDSRPSRYGKTTCGDDADALQYLNKFS